MQALAEQGPVLVPVDQLMLLLMVVQHSSRLRLLLNLIRDLERHSQCAYGGKLPGI